MKKVLSPLRYLLSLHVLGLALLSLLRLALFVCGHRFLSVGGNAGEAFLRGVWFDNVIACYISLVPLVLLTLSLIAGRLVQGTLRFSRWWMAVLWTVAIGISCADIPYFLYFFKHLNSSIWNWAEYGTTTLGMLLGEPSYYPPMLAFLLFIALYIWLSGRMFPSKFNLQRLARAKRIALALLFGLPLIGLCLFGIRGRRGYNPIKVSAAYYCEDAFLNQLGINPAFNLLTSTRDDFRPENKRLHLMDDQEAVTKAKAYLERKGNDEHPLAYQLVPSGDVPAKGYNVVLILMESMSYQLLGKGQTPFLDSLAHQSTFFTNCYSAGNHTNHGIYATLYSYPALMFRNLMKGTVIPHYRGLPTVLHEQGYRNLFFMTHESQYDNMNAFLRTNGFDEIYSQEDYPREKIVNSFGVQDDYLYDYALHRLQSQKNPFFATLLSISNHPPYVIPSYFTPHSKEADKQIVEYTDWSLRQFFEKARRQPWYKRTVFVLLGDHGKLLSEAENEMPESLNHIPLLFYFPGQEPEKRSQWALQMDVQPTLLSMLGISDRQANFGVDLRQTMRPCAFYTADNVIGARSENQLYIYNPSTRQEMCYRNGKLTGRDTTFTALRDYLFSMLQTAEQLRVKHEQ